MELHANFNPADTVHQEGVEISEHALYYLAFFSVVSIALAIYVFLQVAKEESERQKNQ